MTDCSCPSETSSKAAVVDAQWGTESTKEALVVLENRVLLKSVMNSNLLVWKSARINLDSRDLPHDIACSCYRSIVHETARFEPNRAENHKNTASHWLAQLKLAPSDDWPHYFLSQNEVLTELRLVRKSTALTWYPLFNRNKHPIREFAVSDSNQASLGRSHHSDLVGIWNPLNAQSVLNQERIAWIRKRHKHGWLNHLSFWIANEGAITKGGELRDFNSEKVHWTSQVELPVQIRNGEVLSILDKEDPVLTKFCVLVERVLDLKVVDFEINGRSWAEQSMRECAVRE